MSNAEGTLLDFTHLMSVKLRGNDLLTLQTSWDTVIASMKKVPEDGILESMYRDQIQHASLVRDQLARYDIDTEIADRTYAHLHKMVQTILDSKRRRANLEATKAPDNNIVLPSYVSRGACRFWAQDGSCRFGSRCSYTHNPQDEGRGKGNGKGKNKTRSQSPGPKQRSQSPGKNKGQKACSFHNRGRCSHGDKCKFKHNPPCRFFSQGRCTYGKDCEYPHLKQLAAHVGGQEGTPAKSRQGSPSRSASKLAKQERSPSPHPRQKGRGRSTSPSKGKI